jgi:heat shock protein HtpX
MHAQPGKNYAKTAMLMALLIAILVVVGRYVGGYQGMLLFGAIGLLFNFGAWWFSDRIALALHRARPASRSELPDVYEIVEELTRRRGLPMPRVYLLPDPSPNAFATGRSPAKAAVAVTSGLLGVLDRRQVRAVLAHELGHVANRDTLIAAVAAAVAGLITAAASLVRWALILGRGDQQRGHPLADLAFVIVAPIVALLVQLAISRSREYGADASGAALSEDPEGLAQALERIQRGAERVPYAHAGPATAHLFIVNPFSGRSLARLFSTHPPVEERIARLRRA